MQRNLSGFAHSVSTCHPCCGDGCDSALAQGNLSHEHNSQRCMANKLPQVSTMGLVNRKLDGLSVQQEQHNSFHCISVGHNFFFIFVSVKHANSP